MTGGKYSPIIKGPVNNWGTFKYKNVKGYVTRTPWVYELVANDTLTSLVSERFEISLTANQEKKLFEILNKVEADVEYAITDCFYPRHGFVFWDSVGRPSAHISICFECNKLQAQPELDKFDLAELKIFCREIGLPVFDNAIKHKDYFDSLDRKNSH
ncbi:hypothetical protein DQQ10_27055 [Pseudochryseolinea flava]|uniref:Uncharacterized protein n=2 Tax=Pseudochryseolinea flava TaxID=2059302 RepID=A0A364XU82_9BACT|nr:hypothetical protein DQQ10_27055 [Pseudochryseolinea flava]